MHFVLGKELWKLFFFFIFFLPFFEGLAYVVQIVLQDNIQDLDFMIHMYKILFYNPNFTIKTESVEIVTTPPRRSDLPLSNSPLPNLNLFKKKE